MPHFYLTLSWRVLRGPKATQLTNIIWLSFGKDHSVCVRMARGMPERIWEDQTRGHARNQARVSAGLQQAVLTPGSHQARWTADCVVDLAGILISYHSISCSGSAQSRFIELPPPQLNNVREMVGRRGVRDSFLQLVWEHRTLQITCTVLAAWDFSQRQRL